MLQTRVNNLRQINLGLRMYCDDHADKGPAVGAFTVISYKQAIRSYVGLTGASSSHDKVFACPKDTFYYNESNAAYVPAGHHEQPSYDFSSYAFNGLNLLTNYPARQFGVMLPGIAGVPLTSVKEPTKTILVTEWRHCFPTPGINRRSPLRTECLVSMAPKTWSVLWMATSITSKCIGTAGSDTRMAPFRSRPFMIHRPDMIINGVETDEPQSAA